MIQKEATLQDKEKLVDLVGNDKSEIVIHNGKKLSIGWILGITQDKIDHIIVDYESFKKSIKPKDGEQYDDNDLINGNKTTRRFYAKIAAAILLNSYWKIKLLWWLKWRIIYYLQHWTGQDFLNVIIEAKKKAQEPTFSLVMALMMDMTTTWTTMTKKEAEEYRQELQLAREAQLLKNSQD